MTTPQWKTSILEFGFDGTAIPSWLMVPQGGFKEILLDFGEGKVVKSINPRIADIKEGLRDGPSRSFLITGRSPGPPTRIEVRDLQTNALESTLEVSVKRRLDLGILFHFVEDKYSGARTVRSLNIVDGLIDDLNIIYAWQTNIVFSGGFNELEINGSFIDVVDDEVDAETKKPTMEGRLLDRKAWGKIFRKYQHSTTLNIYFVPSTFTPANKNPNILPYTDLDGNCVIEDGMTGLDIILPHSVGRMLGCPFTTKDRQQLMFFDFNIRRTGNFIPKTCANIMNPSGQ